LKQDLLVEDSESPNALLHVRFSGSLASRGEMFAKAAEGAIGRKGGSGCIVSEREKERKKEIAELV
jgi:hypothetical protein